MVSSENCHCSSRVKLLATAVDTIILYAAPLWEKILTLFTARETFGMTQRPMTLRVSQANHAAPIYVSHTDACAKN